LSAVGIDVGGTKVAAGVVDDAGVLLRHLRLTTPGDPAAAVEAIAGAVTELDAVGLPVGVGVAGFVGRDCSTVLAAPNLAWRDEMFGRRLAQRLGVPVHVENDANAAAWAEVRFGAAHDRSAVVCVTVGTGVGGGVVTDGVLLRGGFGLAGEIGHLPVVGDGRPCGCGQRGCLEQYASGTALVRAARDLIAADPAAGAALSAACGGAPEALDGPVITAVAAAGDPPSRRLIADLGDWLGIGLVALSAVVDPECFVIGGGVAEAGELLLGSVRDSFRRRLPGADDRPVAEVVVAALGNDAGMIGAADLARVAVVRQ
jgi:glucokinase